MRVIIMEICDERNESDFITRKTQVVFTAHRKARAFVSHSFFSAPICLFFDKLDLWGPENQSFACS